VYTLEVYVRILTLATIDVVRLSSERILRAYTPGEFALRCRALYVGGSMKTTAGLTRRDDAPRHRQSGPGRRGRGAARRRDPRVSGSAAHRPGATHPARAHRAVSGGHGVAAPRRCRTPGPRRRPRTSPRTHGQRLVPRSGRPTVSAGPLDGARSPAGASRLRGVRRRRRRCAPHRRPRGRPGATAARTIAAPHRYVRMVEGRNRHRVGHDRQPTRARRVEPRRTDATDHHHRPEPAVSCS
jgi:hypothetical protein